MSQVDKNNQNLKIQQKRPHSQNPKENVLCNFSEDKLSAKVDSQKFSFKNYVKNQIQKENQMNEKIDKNNSKTSQPDYVQQLIDLKQQIQKTSFLNLYKKKYCNTEHGQINDEKNIKIPAKTQEMFNLLNNSQGIHNFHKKLQNNRNSVNLKNLQINQKEEIQQKCQFVSEQSQQSINNNNFTSKDFLHKPNSNYSVFIHNNINMLNNEAQNTQKLSGNSLHQHGTQNRQNQLEISKRADDNEQFQVSIVEKQKLSENQEYLKRLINSKQIIQTQNTIEDDESCSSSGEEFDLNLLPKSRLIFKINKISQSNYQSVPSQSRQSMDSNYNPLSQKNKHIVIEEDVQQNNSNPDQDQSISYKLKQIVAKRKFASENIQQQQIKNLHKLMPHVFEKVEKRQQRVSKSSITPKKRQTLFEEIKTLNSQESTNQNFQISSEETDVDLNEAKIYKSNMQSFNNQFFSTSMNKQELKTYQSGDKQTDKGRFIVKGRPSKILKQMRSQSVNSNKFQNKKDESENNAAYPMINILLCSTKNQESIEKQKDFCLTSSSIFPCQEKRLHSTSLNNLSNQISSKHSNDPSPTNHSIYQESKPLSTKNSSEALNTKKKQTIKLGQVKTLLLQNKAKLQKEKFTNYHLVLKESNQKDLTKKISNQFRNRRSMTSLKNNILDTTSRQILINSQKSVNCSLNNPIIVQSIQRASLKNNSSYMQQSQQNQNASSFQQQCQQLLIQKINKQKQVNFSYILDTSSSHNNNSKDIVQIIAP